MFTENEEILNFTIKFGNCSKRMSRECFLVQRSVYFLHVQHFLTPKWVGVATSIPCNSCFSIITLNLSMVYVYLRPSTLQLCVPMATVVMAGAVS